MIIQIDCPYEPKEVSSDLNSDEKASGYERKYSSRLCVRMNHRDRHLIWIQMNNLPFTKENIHPDRLPIGRKRRFI